MVVEAVAHLVIGDVLGWFGHPMQHLHAIAACAGGDYVQDFPRATVTTDFHAGQVAYIADQRAGIGSGCMELANPLATTVVEVVFIVVFAVCADHRAHAGQLIAQVPVHRLAGLQFTQVAIAIEAGSQFGFSRWTAVAFGQAAVAEAGAGQCAAMTLSADMHQVQQITASVVVIGLGVLGDLVGIEGQGLQVGQGRAAVAGLGFPTLGFDQLIEGVVAIVLDRLDALVVEVADWLGGVFEAQHVAGGVVAVFQILQWRAVGFVGAQDDEAAIRWIVAVTSDHAVAGGF
ncbi:hypothetical protein D3C76_732320 [compost metagenome]